MTARAQFELHEFEKAAETFARLRQLAPSIVEGMDTYSTTLWHLKRLSELAALAQQMAACDKRAPQTWCVLGNW